MRLSRRQILAGTLALARCASAPPPARPAWAVGGEPLYVIATEWHTEIGLSASLVTAPLAQVRADFAGADSLIFGWGQRDFYMDPNPSLGVMLRAAFPGPSVMLVQPLRNPPPLALGPPSRVVTLHTSDEGMARLCDYIWGFLAKDANGRATRTGPGPCEGCEFYASDGTYDLHHTCNTWTAETLRAGGFPVDPDGVITSAALMRQIT